MKALVLDFDGVISDSAPEAFVVALRSYVGLHPRSSFKRILIHLRSARGSTLDHLRNTPLYARFLELMPLGNRAEDYGVILSIIEQGLEINDQEDYDQQRLAVGSLELNRFHGRFYQMREGFFRNDPRGWRALIGPYPRFVDALRRHANETTLAIATAKDRNSVTRLLKDYAIDDLFADELVLDKDTAVNKTIHLQHLHRDLNLEYAEMSFMDDKVNHLDAVAPLGVRCALASWGYNSDREYRLAEQRGYLLCTLDDVEQRLFNQPG